MQKLYQSRHAIWHGQAPRIISTFLESYEFDGKTIIPFCTSQSSGIGSSASELHSLSQNANWIGGERFSANTSTDEVVTWLDTLNINVKNTEKIGEFNFENQMVLLNGGYEMTIMVDTL